MEVVACLNYSACFSRVKDDDWSRRNYGGSGVSRCGVKLMKGVL